MCLVSDSVTLVWIGQQPMEDTENLITQPASHPETSSLSSSGLSRTTLLTSELARTAMQCIYAKHTLDLW